MEAHTNYVISAAQIFTIFFIMLGPLRITKPFALATSGMDSGDRKQLAVKISLIATAVLSLGGFLGKSLLNKWHIAPAVLMLSAGIIFFLVAIRPLTSHGPAIEPATERKPPKASDLATHLVVTSYGLAAMIVLMSASKELARVFTILGCLIAVMFLNFLAMFFTKPDSKSDSGLLMEILGTILGVMQFALALQIIVASLEHLGIF